MTIRGAPLVGGLVALVGGVGLIAAFAPTNYLIAYAQVGSGVLAVVVGLYLTLIVSWHELRDDDPRSPRLYSLVRREVRGRALRTASSWAVRFHERERLATIRGGLRTWLMASGLERDGGQLS